jgi:hypothetical protein
MSGAVSRFDPKQVPLNAAVLLTHTPKGGTDSPLQRRGGTNCRSTTAGTWATENGRLPAPMMRRHGAPPSTTKRHRVSAHPR